MGDVVNLNKFRKQKARTDRARTADANRAKFGRTNAERDQQAKVRDLAVKRHEGNRIERDDEKPE